MVCGATIDRQGCHTVMLLLLGIAGPQLSGDDDDEEEEDDNDPHAWGDA